MKSRDELNPRARIRFDADLELTQVQFGTTNIAINWPWRPAWMVNHKFDWLDRMAPSNKTAEND